MKSHLTRIFEVLIHLSSPLQGQQCRTVMSQWIPHLNKPDWEESCYKRLPTIEMNKKSPEKSTKVRKIRNMFVLRKGNSTKDSNLIRQNSNDNVYGLERQSSINSLINSDSYYSRDNSIENQTYIRNQKQASSNGFVKSSFNPSIQGSIFKTPRLNGEEKPKQITSCESSEGYIHLQSNASDLQNCTNNFNIANRNIKIRSIASIKGDWKTKSNGFKDFNDQNYVVINANANNDSAESDNSRFNPISIASQN